MPTTVNTTRDLRGLWDRGRAVVTDAVSRYRAAQAIDPTSVDRARQQSSALSQERLASVCSSLALRNLNLVDLAIERLETIYQNEGDPDKLANLYHIDNLAIRLRRNAENLRVLAGRDNDDASADSASLVDLLRAALSSIRQHDRIALGQIVSIGVVGPAAADVGRVLTELLDNGADNSPPTSQVRASAHLTETGSVLVRVEDDGIGLSEERLAVLNRRLTSPAALDRDAVRHMGLAVVSSLAHRHRLRVRLQRRVPQGTTALVTIPASLVCDLPTALWSGGNTVTGPRSGRTIPANRPFTDPSPRQRPPSAPASQTTQPRPLARPKVENPAPPREPTVSSTTDSGLPRRVPASLRSEASVPDPEPVTPATPVEARAGNEQLIADFGAFERGQHAAEAPDQQSGDLNPGPQQ